MKISGKCLFCGSVNIGQGGSDFKSGELIQCNDCGEFSDYDSISAIAIEEAQALVKEQLQAQLKSVFGAKFKPKR
ncbi:hypothetical protein [Vibrio atlanticus]|uniref:hypothetical protein n=1 Tax=Vibrio atlanticus TaxID=693153 RepID=UPI00354F5061